MSLRRSSRRLACSSPNQALITAAVLAALAVPAAAQLQFEELPRKGLPVDTDETRAVALGDVDGDGDLDMVIGNDSYPNGQQNRLYLNNGPGTFSDATASQMPVVNDNTYSVALGDVDGDGDLDMVFASWPQNRLYLNNGTGTFTDVSAVQMPVGSSMALALGDVDGDGDLDIVGLSQLYLNDGAGNFIDVSATHMPAAVGQLTSLTLGDVDGDGDLDVVCGARTGPWGIPFGQNRLYLNNGLGTFVDATTQLPVENSCTFAVTLGDVDGDGDPDLVAAQGQCGLGGGGGNRLYLNDGTGTFRRC